MCAAFVIASGAFSAVADPVPFLAHPPPPPLPPDAPLHLDSLRVCSDPNNLPFSNRAKEGFENRIAELLATDLGVPLEYEWLPQRRGFIRQGLNAGKCNVVMGEATGLDMVSTTRPYYRSTYVFLARRDHDPGVTSLDDPKLRQLKIGVHLIGDDYINTPPAHALGERNIQVVGFPLLGDYGKPNPPARLVEAVASGKVDIAVIWGPFAGYFADKEGVPMTIRPVKPAFDPPAEAFVYSISMAVRSGNFPLRKRLNEFIERHRADIDGILAAYHVPRADRTAKGN